MNKRKETITLNDAVALAIAVEHENHTGMRARIGERIDELDKQIDMQAFYTVRSTPLGRSILNNWGGEAAFNFGYIPQPYRRSRAFVIQFTMEPAASHGSLEVSLDVPGKHRAPLRKLLRKREKLREQLRKTRHEWAGPNGQRRAWLLDVIVSDPEAREAIRDIVKQAVARRSSVKPEAPKKAKKR